jgi:hypothetical protein
MLDVSNMVQLGKDIYVYKNFLSKTDLNSYNKEILFFDEKDWTMVGSEERDVYWHTQPTTSLRILRNRLNNLTTGKLFVGDAFSFIRMLNGASWPLHSDIYSFNKIVENSKKYKDGEPFIEESIPVYGLIVYFNNFDGGEIYYPNQNVEYHPNAGDLVIHSSEEHCYHGVKPVLSDVRYSYSNNIRKIIKVPVNGS